MRCVYNHYVVGTLVAEAVQRAWFDCYRALDGHVAHCDVGANVLARLDAFLESQPVGYEVIACSCVNCKY